MSIICLVAVDHYQQFYYYFTMFKCLLNFLTYFGVKALCSLDYWATHSAPFLLHLTLRSEGQAEHDFSSVEAKSFSAKENNQKTKAQSRSIMSHFFLLTCTLVFFSSISFDTHFNWLVCFFLARKFDSNVFVKSQREDDWSGGLFNLCGRRKYQSYPAVQKVTRTPKCCFHVVGVW